MICLLEILQPRPEFYTADAWAKADEAIRLDIFLTQPFRLEALPASL